MKRTVIAGLGLAFPLALALASAPVRAAAVVGQAAPDVTIVDTRGQTLSLSSYKGRHVVLEWVNFECPFVQKHYSSGNMQKLQRTYTGKGVVWLSVNSSAPGKQGHYTTAEIDAKSRERTAAYSAYLLDSDGKAGRAYGAKTTPHMFVIDPAGKVIYAGGIDDTPSTDVADIATARNHVQHALDEALAGKPVSVATSQPYGCGVKY